MARRALTIALATSSLAPLACGPRGRTAAPGVVIAAARDDVTRAAAASPAERRPEGAPRVEGDPAIELPREVGCSYQALSWERVDLRLRFRAGGSAYAVATESVEHVRVALPVGDAGLGATVDVETFGVRLRGVVDASEVRLYAARPVVVGGVAVPSGSMPLRWQSTGAGSVAWALPDAVPVRFAGGARGLAGPCDDLKAERSFFHPADAPGLGAMAPLREATLRRGARVPLSVTPGAPAAAAIELGPDDDDDVAIVAVRGPMARIRWEGPFGETGERYALVFGWVPRSSLGPPSPGDTSGGVGGVYGGPLHPFGCPEELALYADLEGERRRVGQALRGTRVTVGGEAGDGDESELVPVSIAGPGFYAPPPPTLWPGWGARFLMRRADAARCAG